MPQSGATLSAPPQPLATKLGLADARHVIVPDGIVSSGLPAVRATCAQIGLDLDPWQVGVARCILAKDADGLYSADTAALSIPRQVGKTYLVAALVFADCIIHPGTTTIWTAHRFKVARETFNALKGIATAPALAPHIDPDAIYTAAGNESITFRNGSRIVFAARERGAVRGFSKVRRLILDEAQILTEAAMADLAPTMNQAENPQMILMGTPPKPTDPGETFGNLRTEALEGTSEGVVYIEFSADDDADLDDRDAWRRANPSYPLRTPTRAIQRLRKLLADDDDFAREALGMWRAADSGVIVPVDVWQGLTLESARPGDVVAFGVDVSPDSSWTSIGIASRNADGRPYVEVIESGRGTGWVVDRLVELQSKWRPLAITLNPGGPAGALLTGLAERGVEPLLPGVRELGQACGEFFVAATETGLVHRGEPLLSVAVAGARKRKAGDAWVWQPASGKVDIAPLWAVTLALHAFLSLSHVKGRSGKASFF